MIKRLRAFWVWLNADNRPECIQLRESVQISAAMAAMYLFPPTWIKDPAIIIICFLVSAIHVLGMNYSINQIRRLSHG